MATRSKAKSASTAASKQAAAKRGTTETPGTPVPADSDKAASGKTKAVKPAAKRGRAKSTTAPAEEKLCPCAKGDIGTPMVLCGTCSVWYHFACVNLEEDDAHDIRFYVCPDCTKATSRRTTMIWEGPSAFEDPEESVFVPSQPKTTKPNKPVSKKPVVDETESESSSEDEFVMEVDKKPQVPQSKRRRQAVASGTESSSEGSDTNSHKRPRRRLRKGSPSPAPGRAPEAMKRKASTSEARPSVKKSKSGSLSATDDPTRKYCLGQLQNLFRDIFFRYPHVPLPESKEFVQKAPDDLTEEEKDALAEASKRFTVELEQAIFETADHDKNGKPTPGINYKDRFRTLQFNLSKSDRVVIHQRIASRNIAPKDLSLMSSTDLANEETKQIIKIAEQEALEHSILPKTVAPRAKYTHKGIEDIEIDAEAPSTTAPDYEAQRAREKEAEERRERERMARLKGLQRQRTASMSVPPESPTVAQHPPTNDAHWGAPPPVPSHAQGPTLDGEEGPALTRRTVVPPTPQVGGATTTTSIRHTPEPEPELNMADYIHMEEDPTPSSEEPTNPPAGTMDPFAPPLSATTTSPVSSDTPIQSTFAPPPPQKSSFNLDALWSGPVVKEQGESPSPPVDDEEVPMVLSPASLSPPPLKEEEETKGLDDEGTSPLDQEPDFDMLFEDRTPSVAPPKALSVQDLPQVWQGTLSMPLDSSTSQETQMKARQVAGPPLDAGSVLWKTLFPSEHLRIDGRVQVNNSATYLTQMRLSPQKELYAVAFTPSTPNDEPGFQTLSDFLVSKDRHGLIFPWGPRPKEYHPGKELYVIPLKAEEPLPEYMELLDHLKIPKQRERNYLIGVWVLMKGRLAPLPSVQPRSPPVIVPPVGATPPAINTPTTAVPLPTIPLIPQIHPPTHVPTPPTALAPTPAQPTPTPLNPLIPPYANLPPGVDPVALANEVASLTPEQIQTLLRTLQVTGQTLPLPIPQVPAVPAATPAIPAIPPAYPPYQAHTTHLAPPYGAPPPPPPAAQHSWQGSHSPYNAQQYPAYNDAWSIPTSSSHQGMTPGHDRRDRGPPPYGQQHGHHPHQHGGEHRGGGNWRGKNKGRSSGGGGNWDRNQQQHHQHNQQREEFRPVDSGWPRKQQHNAHYNDGYNDGYDNRRQQW